MFFCDYQTPALGREFRAVAEFFNTNRIGTAIILILKTKTNSSAARLGVLDPVHHST